MRFTYGRRTRTVYGWSPDDPFTYHPVTVTTYIGGIGRLTASWAGGRPGPEQFGYILTGDEAEQNAELIDEGRHPLVTAGGKPRTDAGELDDSGTVAPGRDLVFQVQQGM